uniref:Histone-lysine N-methyltransferase, H3 lysine-79 specific n=1 Tax=Mesocestoides corti TaxID=53468 RepID=A0A5K3EY57_MESCO
MFAISVFVIQGHYGCGTSQLAFVFFLFTAPVSRNPSLRARRLHCSTSGNHSHHRDGLIKSSSSCDVAASSSSTTCAPNKCPGNADTALGALHRRTVKNFEDAGEQRGDPSLPYADQPVPLALSQHLELTKQVFMQHFSQMRTPEYAERVRAELERERLRQTQLLEHASELEGTIKQMHAHGFELLTAFTKKISRLSETNKDLARRYQAEAAHLQQELQRAGPPPLLPTPPDEYYSRHHHHHHHHHHHSRSKRQRPPRLVPETDSVMPSPRVTRVSDSPPPPSLAAYPPPPNLSPVTKPTSNPLPQRSDLTSNMISNSYLASGVPLLPVRKRHYLSKIDEGGGGLEQCAPHADPTPPLKAPRIF